MNKHFDDIRGHGMRTATGLDTMPTSSAEDILAASDAEDDKLNASLADDMARELPKATLLAGKRAALERTIASTRTEMVKQQQIAASALDKFRQLKISLRADEDSLDALPFE